MTDSEAIACPELVEGQGGKKVLHAEGLDFKTPEVVRDGNGLW